jgi:hypothetical protein
MRAGRRSRGLLVTAAAVGAFAALPASQAAAHVHGLTPLRCVGTNNDGADRTDDTPAAAANGGPIRGLIPRDVGRSPLDIGDGGFDTPGCPAP